MLKWAIWLNGFDIVYEPRRAIKGQALADFIVELTRPPQQEGASNVWKLFVDGSTTQDGCGAGIQCRSPEGDVYEYAMKFNFQATNNEAEYEALITGIKMCKAVGAQRIDAMSDSQLFVSQVNGEYEARDQNMAKYLEMVKVEIQDLDSFILLQVPR